MPRWVSVVGDEPRSFDFARHSTACVVLLALVVHPALGGERKLLELVGSEVERLLRILQGLVEVLLHLREVVGHLEVGDGAREVARPLLQQELADPVALAELPAAAQRGDQGRRRRRAQHLAGIQLEHPPGGGLELLPAVEREAEHRERHEQRRILGLGVERLLVGSTSARSRSPRARCSSAFAM